MEKKGGEGGEGQNNEQTGRHWDDSGVNGAAWEKVWKGERGSQGGEEERQTIEAGEADIVNAGVGQTPKQKIWYWVFRPLEAHTYY